MSGMRIGVVYPTWPDMNGSFIPQVVFNKELYNVDNFNMYDQNELMPALIHILHRTTAYIVYVLGTVLGYKMIRNGARFQKNLGRMLIIVLISQVLIGIGTVINCIGEIPVSWGVAHQGGALLCLFTAYLCYYNIKLSSNKGITM